VPRRESELIDRPGVPEAALRANLRDQMRLNRWLGGTRRLRRHARAMLASSPGPVARILDAGCGGADGARAVAAEARHQPLPVSVVALDRSRAVLDAARSWTDPDGPVALVGGELGRPPLAAGAFDLTLCANTLHHLEPDAVAPALAALAAVTRGRLVVTDLRRSRALARVFPLLARLAGLHAMSRHDGAVSLRNALAPEELAAAAAAAGLTGCRVTARGWWLELVWDRPATRGRR
jgi:SAM-dependent methyltransferase